MNVNNNNRLNGLANGIVGAITIGDSGERTKLLFCKVSIVHIGAYLEGDGSKCFYYIPWHRKLLPVFEIFLENFF